MTWPPGTMRGRMADVMRTVPDGGSQVVFMGEITWYVTSHASHVMRHVAHVTLTCHASRVTRHESRTLQSLTMHVAAQSGASNVLVEGVALKRNPCVTRDA